MIKVVSGNEKAKSEAIISTTFEVQAIQRSFDRVQSALFATEVSIPNITDREKSDAIEAVIVSTMENFRLELNKEMERQSKILSDNAIDAESVSFSDPYTYEVEVNSSRLSQFIALIQQYDQLLSTFEILRLHSIFDSQQTIEATKFWRKRVNKVSSKIIGQVSHSLRAIYAQHAADSKESQQAKAQNDSLMNIEDAELKQEVETEANALEASSTEEAA